MGLSSRGPGFRVLEPPNGLFPVATVAIRERNEELGMQDLIFIAATIAFFVLSIAYVYGCERLK